MRELFLLRPHVGDEYTRSCKIASYVAHVAHVLAGNRLGAGASIARPPGPHAQPARR